MDLGGVKFLTPTSIDEGWASLQSKIPKYLASIEGSARARLSRRLYVARF